MAVRECKFYVMQTEQQTNKIDLFEPLQNLVPNAVLFLLFSMLFVTDV